MVGGLEEIAVEESVLEEIMQERGGLSNVSCAEGIRPQT